MGRRGQTLIEIDGVHIVPIRRTGKPTRWYIYAWRGGPCVRKTVGEDRPVLTVADVKACDDAKEDGHKVKANTLAGLIRRYRKSPTGWLALAKGTQRTWEAHLDAIEARWPETPLTLWSDARMRPKVIKWRDERAETPRTANIGLDVMNHLLGWGEEQGSLTVNIAKGLPRLDEGEGRPEIIWTADHLEAFGKVASIQCWHAVRLASLTGLRRQDLIRLSWAHVGEHAIVMTAEKKSAGKRRRVTVPIIPKLRQLLDELRKREVPPGVETILWNGNGNSWVGDGLTQRINKWKKRAKIMHLPASVDDQPRELHLHDLRGTFATELMKVTPRLTDEEIGDILGWDPKNVSEIRKRYVDDAAIVVALAQRIGGTGL